MNDLCKKAIFILGNAGSSAQWIMTQARETLSRNGYTVVGSGSRSNGGIWWTDIAKHNGWLIQQNDVFKQHRILGPGDQCYATIQIDEKLRLLLKTIIEIGTNLEQQKSAEIENARAQERKSLEAEQARERQRLEEEKKREAERKAKEAEARRRKIEKERENLEKESSRGPLLCGRCGTELVSASDKFCNICGKPVP